VANTRLELFYDVVSPYTCLAFSVLERYCAPTSTRWPVELVLRPAFLAGVMKSVGNVPPASLPQRAPYLLRDLGRLTSYVDVPLQVPEGFPANTIQAMRFLTVVERDRPERLAAVSRALFAIHWGEGRPLAAPEVLLEAAGRAGLEAAEAASLAARTSDQEIKDRLKKTTDEVVERGAFGFPAMFVDIDGSDEMFFGHDRLELLAHALKLPWAGPKP
jgi:glutathione S-transferase kappa 1